MLHVRGARQRDLDIGQAGVYGLNCFQQRSVDLPDRLFAYALIIQEETTKVRATLRHFEEGSPDIGTI